MEVGQSLLPYDVQLISMGRLSPIRKYQQLDLLVIFSTN